MPAPHKSSSLLTPSHDGSAPAPCRPSRPSAASLGSAPVSCLPPRPRAVSLDSTPASVPHVMTQPALPRRRPRPAHPPSVASNPKYTAEPRVRT